MKAGRPVLGLLPELLVSQILILFSCTAGSTRLKSFSFPWLS